MSSMDVNDAFQFFGLEVTATEEVFKHRFHELALKYHPDKGEFNSEVVFLELMKLLYKNLIKTWPEFIIFQIFINLVNYSYIN